MILQFVTSQLPSSIVPMIAIGFHSLLDGLIYAVTFDVDIFTGVLAAAGMVLHEFPEGIAFFLHIIGISASALTDQTPVAVEELAVMVADIVIAPAS